MRLRDLLSETSRPDWLNRKMSLEQAIEIATQHATELGRGANRVAFKLPDNRVLKLATTKGGLDANATEIQLLGNVTIKKFGVTVPIIDAGDDHTWLITEFTKPATAQLFQKFTGSTLTDLINYAMDAMEPTVDIFDDPTPIQTSTNANAEWVQTFKRFCGKVAHITPIGEFADISNWGEYNGRPVLIDLGATFLAHRGMFMDAIRQL